MTTGGGGGGGGGGAGGEQALLSLSPTERAWTVLLEAATSISLADLARAIHRESGTFGRRTASSHALNAWLLFNRPIKI